MSANSRIFRTTSDLQPQDIRKLYDRLHMPITRLDCGQKCAPHNPSGKPFCCDICQAVPAVYKSEWNYLQDNTQLWHTWQGNECSTTSGKERARLKAETPNNMLLLACLGPAQCERDFRALSCRQFPFFPYVTSGYRFIGLAYDWEFETKCWVLSNLAQVTKTYREAFVSTFDELFALFQSEFDGYAYRSEELRAEYTRRKKRFPVLHRNGGYYLVSPLSERMQRVNVEKLPTFQPYR